MPTPNSNLPANDLPEWFDPFPEPHTIPSGWDFDSLVPSQKQQAVVKDCNPTEPSPAGAPGTSEHHA